MTSLFDKMNLRPFERRLIAVVGIALFIAAQVLFVWPHFGDVKKMGVRRQTAEDTLKLYNDELAQAGKFKTEVAKLESEGLAVPPEDQATELLRAIQTQASQWGVTPQNISKPMTRTNQFFLEQSVQVTTVSTEDQLVNFLYNLGAGNSLIRVRDLTLRPDSTRLKLSATIKLVASYQKKIAAQTAATNSVTARTPAKAPPGAPARPVVTPQSSPSTRKKP
jgi:Tfp pilus assembly protein PilO